MNCSYFTNGGEHRKTEAMIPKPYKQRINPRSWTHKPVTTRNERKKHNKDWHAHALVAMRVGRERKGGIAEVIATALAHKRVVGGGRGERVVAQEWSCTDNNDRDVMMERQ